MTSTSSPTVSVVDTVIQQIFADFNAHGGVTLSLGTLVSTGIAVAQSVMTTLSASASTQISAVVDVLKLLAGQNVTLSTSDLTTLQAVIEGVMPSVIAALTQVEQGCIILCDDIVTETEGCFSRWCCKKSKTSSTPTITTTVKTSTPTTTSVVSTTTTPVVALPTPSTSMTTSTSIPELPLVIRQTSTGSRTVAPANNKVLSASEPSVSRLVHLETLLKNTVHLPSI